MPRLLADSRASILTGRHPVRVDITDWLSGMPEKRIRDRRLIQPQDRNELALEEVTLAEHLKSHAYRTFFAGKWHLGGEGFLPEHQGFDTNIGGTHKGSPGEYSAPFKSNPKLPPLPTDTHLTTRLTDEAVRFLRSRSQEQSFFLYLSYYNVHTPIRANRELVGRFYEKAAVLPGRTRFEPEHTVKTRTRQDNPAYASMVAAVDRSVGRLLDELEELGLDDDTIVVFFSDNGGLATTGRGGPTSNLGLRAGKGWLYEGGIRAPMVIRAPGVSRRSSVIETPAISTDFFLTLLDLIGLTAREELHYAGVGRLAGCILDTCPYQKTESGKPGKASAVLAIAGKAWITARSQP